MATETTMNRIASHYHVLEDGTCVSSRWAKEIGDRHAHPITGKMVPIKFTLTKAEYRQCLENGDDLQREFEELKGTCIREGRGFGPERKAETLGTLFDRHYSEPLMRESIFLAMAKLK